MDLNNLILILILIGLNILFYKRFLLILNKYNPSLLIDDQLKKPQAFHISPTPVIGGRRVSISSCTKIPWCTIHAATPVRNNMFCNSSKI